MTSGTEIKLGITLVTTFALVVIVVTPKTGVTRTIIVPSTSTLSAVIPASTIPGFKGRLGVNGLEFVSGDEGVRGVD
jgi:hypothetical protein